MIKAEASTAIRRPIGQLFENVTDPRNEPEWHTDVGEASPVEPGPFRVGTTIRYVFPFMGRRVHSIGEVVAYDAPHLESIKFSSGPMGLAPTITYLFEPLPEGTRFTRRIEAAPSGLVGVFEPLMTRMIASRNARFVENLRRRFKVD